MARKMLIRVQPKIWCLDFVDPLKMSHRVALNGKLDRTCHSYRQGQVSGPRRCYPALTVLTMSEDGSQTFATLSI